MRESSIPEGWPEHETTAWARLARQAARTLQELWDGQQFSADTSAPGTPQAPGGSGESGEPSAAVEAVGATERQAVPSTAASAAEKYGGPEGASGETPPTNTQDGEPQNTPASDAGSEEAAPQSTSGDTATADTLGAESAGTVARRQLTIVSLRCTQALINLADVVPEWASAAVRVLIAKDLVPAVASLDVERFAQSATSELTSAEHEQKLFPYAAALLTSTMARTALIDVSQYRTQEIDRGELRAHAARAREQIVAVSEIVIEQTVLVCLRFNDSERGGDWIAGCVHPIVIYRLAGALWLSGRILAADAGEQQELISRLNDAQARLAEHARRLTERLIALHELQPGEQGEHVALAFCAGALARPQSARRDYIIAACRASLGGQDAGGRWPAERSASEHSHPDGEGELSVSTYDVADVLAESLLAASTQDGRMDSSRPPSRELVDGLLRAAQHADDSIVELDVQDGEGVSAGWHSDHVFGQRRVEADATAAVLNSMVGLRELANGARRLQALGGFEIANPRDEFWPEWLRWDRYKADSEPDSKLKILEYLHTEVVQQVVQDPLPWQRTAAKGLLLFGPPGTTKTTIVRALAHGLRWPLITLSPGNFIEEGLEAIEKQARLVFERLHSLQRAVVLFDECDELFRERNPSESSDQTRGIAAFMTASMLPKLQDLHDRGQVIFVVVTNYFQTMDPAIKRIGRIDHIIGVPWPDRAQRESIVREVLSANDAPTNEAVKTLLDKTDGFIRGELLKAVESLKGRTFDSTAAAREAARSAVESLGEKTISKAAMEEFEKQANGHSAPHIRAKVDG